MKPECEPWSTTSQPRIASTKVRYTGPGVSKGMVAIIRSTLQCLPLSDVVNKSSGAWSVPMFTRAERTTQPREGLRKNAVSSTEAFGAGAGSRKTEGRITQCRPGRDNAGRSNVRPRPSTVASDQQPINGENPPGCWGKQVRRSELITASVHVLGRQRFRLARYRKGGRATASQHGATNDQHDRASESAPVGIPHYLRLFKRGWPGCVMT